MFYLKVKDYRVFLIISKFCTKQIPYVLLLIWRKFSNSIICAKSGG